ncbi:GGDEF domain-containing protein [Endothiovibrio diazotrophicus]
MTSAIDRLLRNTPPTAFVLAAVALIALFGLLDHLTGLEFNLQLFAPVPVAAATWYRGWRAGVTLALVAGGVWIASAWGAGVFHPREIASYWDGVAQLVLSLAAAWLADTARRELREERSRGDHDPLTQLPNRRAFEGQLTLEGARLRRYHDPFTAAYLHLGGLQQVREEMGGEVADELLRQVARWLQGTTRESDHIALIRGHGFGALFPKTEWGGAQLLLKRLHEELTETLSHGEWPVEPRIGAITFGHGAGTATEMSEALEQLIDETRRNRGGGTLHRHWRGASPSNGTTGRRRDDDD